VNQKLRFLTNIGRRLNEHLADQWIAFLVLLNATTVAWFLRLCALDRVLVRKMRRNYFLDATRLLCDGGYRGSNPSGILAIHPVGVARYLDNPVLAGNAKMKPGLYFFRLEPLVDVLDDCLGDIGVGGL